MSDVNGKVAVLGTGTMGQGIAQICAMTGHATRLFDVAPDRARKAVDAISAQLDKLVAKGKLAPDAREGAMARLAPAQAIGAACEGVDVVIEAVPEDMALKVGLFEEVVRSVYAPSAEGEGAGESAPMELMPGPAALRSASNIHPLEPVPAEPEVAEAGEVSA